jgi:hypothetical protein
MPSPATYIHLAPGEAPPEIEARPSRFVVVIEAEVSYQWQKLVSDWMVESGCLYMIAWGRECSTWDDSVDWANIDKYGDGPIPDDKFVMTTWHKDTSLSYVFWFSKVVAEHPSVDIVRTIILDISAVSRKYKLLRLYESA